VSDEFTLTDEQIQQALGPVSGRSARPELSLVQPDPEPEPTPAPEPLDLSWRPDDPNERRDIPPAFDWDAAAQQMKADDERAIRGRLNLAKKDNPDTQAKVQRLSSATGLPPDLVARDPEDVQRRHEVASIDLDQLRRDAPITYSRLTDPQFLGVAHDDIQTMGSLERWIKGSALSAVGGATVGVGSAALDASAFVARGLSAVTPEIAGVDFFGRAAADLSARAGAADEALKWLIPDAESSTESAFQSGFQSFGQNMALMPLGVAQASAQAAGAAIAYAFGAVTGAKAYGEATREGKGDLTAGIHGATQALIETGTEMIPAIRFFEMLGSRTGVVEMLAKQVGWEGATEQIATLLQDMGDWLVMNQDGTLKEFLEARPEAAYQTLIATLVGTVAQVGTMKGIMAVADRASGRAQSQQKAQDGANALQRAFDIVAKSKTQERSPETIAEFVADVAPDQSLYVDAQVLNQSARKMPPEEFTRLFPKTAEQMAEALVTHSDVEMPLSEVLAAAGTDLESVLVENARLDDNPETLSSADAKAEVKIAEEMIKADAERVMQQAADQDAWAQSADEVYQAVLADLNTANRFTPEVNEVYAILTRDLFSSLASRVGMTPREFFQKYRLRSAGQSQGGQELSQDGIQTDTPAFREWFGNSKVVDESGKPLVVYHGTADSISEFDLDHPNRHDTGWLGTGVYTTSNAYTAGSYASLKAGSAAPNVMPLYVSIQNPYQATLQDKQRLMLISNSKGAEAGRAAADEWTAELKAQGYDGVIVNWRPESVGEKSAGREIVAFSPTQVKSSLGNNGQFSREDPNILHQSVWSSTLKTRISEQSNKTRTGKEWGQWLAANLSKLGIKKAEVEANGILDYLELKGKEKVTGADIAAWLDANGVQVTETVLGSTNSELNAMNAELAGSGYSAEYDAYSAEVAYIDPDGESIEFDDMPEDVQEIIQRRIDGTVERAETEQTKFDQYQLPGGENYRELLLTLPDASTSIESGGRYRVRFFDETGRDRIEHATMPQVEAFRRRGNRAEVLGPVITNDDSRNFRSSHFDQPNILAHIRFNERTDSEGNRVLFIEEIQSDWAQEGRKEGFNARSVSEIDAELSAVNKERSRLLQEAADLPDSEMAKFREMNARIKELAQRAQELDAQAQEAVGKNKVPSAPFVTDTKAWVALSLKRMIRYAADNGFDRIAWTTGEQQYNRYPEADAESDVGKKRNEGMRAFYDNIVPQVANELLKKMGGGKVETVDVGIGGVRWSVNWVEDGSEIDSTVSYTSEREATDAAKEWTDQTGDAAEVRAIPRPSPQSGFTLTDSLRDVAAGGMPLFQGGAESLATFNPEKLLITIKEKSNLSSYPHELGHFYLEVLADVASQPDAPQQIVDDMNTVLAWFGVPDLATWNGYTLAEKEVYHEKYAESFEQYLFEGKAPSVELQLIFRRFRAWMMSVYKNLTQFLKQNKNADLNDEIRQVMDRMVATDEAIAAAEKAAGMDSDFEATNTAIEALQKRSLANVKWLTNAKSRLIKALQKQAESLRKGVREEISAKLQKEPVYRAIAYIRKGSITGPGGTQIKLEKGTTRKLSRAAVEQMFDADSPLPWRAALEGMLAESGADPDFIAQEVGFSSGAEMVDALIRVEPLKDAIERDTDRVMLERHGELTTPELVEQAANEAVHNKARARALAAELTSQQEALSARETAGTTPRGKTVTVNAVMAAAKRFAANLVARKKIRDLKRAAQLHRSAEAKASKAWAKATAAGKTAEAIQAKRDQALNNAAARAMLEAVAETEKALEYLKKFDRATIRKNIPIDYLEQIDNLLERVDLRKSVSGKALDRRESLRQWYTAQEEMGLTPVIPKYLLDDAQLTSYKDMTVEELRGLVDSVKNIEHLGKLKHKLLTLKDKREFDALVDEMVASIEANGGKVKVIPPEGRGPADKWMNGFLATHRKFASVMRQMDGLNDDGIFWQTLVRAMNDRATDEQVRLAAATEHLGKLIQPLIDMPGGLEGGKRLVRALKAPMSRAGRIAVMLNTGNTQNRQRMEDGNGITAAAIEEIAAQMTPAELEFVNQAWEFVDSFWPEVKAKQERVTGLSEDKVEAEPFEAIANDGTRVQMRGGYYPIKYDPDQSVVAHKQEATQTALEMFRGAITRATTRRAHTEARVKEVKGRPVRLNLEVLSSHTAEVIHDLVWHEWLIDANRVLSDPRVSEAIRKHQGPDTLRTLKDDLVGVAGGDIVAMDSIDKAMMRLRANISRAVMGISMTTGLLQPFGILQSVVRVGWGPVLRGLGRWAGDAAQLESSMTWIREKSPFMKLRAQTFNRELYEINKRIKGKWKVTEIVDAGLFMMMQKMQMVADIPTWIGTYQKVLEETHDEALAIAQADRAVKESQGSGQTVDLSAVQRDHPFLTQFYSYFNTTLNLAAESTSQTDFKNPKAVAGWVSDMALLMIVPAIIPSLLISLFRGEGDDDDAADWALKLAGWQVSYLAGLFVGVREFSGIIQGFDYSGPPVGRILNDIGRMGKQIGQGEVDEAAVIAAANVLGSGLGLPTVQLLRFYKGWKAWEEGEAPPTAVLFGPPHK
jgi:hypothetical protein